ncbi:MAG: YrbL family protein [Phycisphaerales bacterium]
MRLEDSKPFAVGGRRWCFVDPRDPGRCIKVNRTDALRYGRTQPGLILPAKWRRAYDNNLDDHRQLGSLMRRIGDESYDHLPRTYGFVETDLGQGLVIDLFRDRDGAISRTLRELLCTGADPAQFDSALDDLGAFMVRHRVLTRKLLDHNIVAQDTDRGWRLHIIDGVGEGAFVPVRRLVPALARRRIAERIEEFRAVMRERAANPDAPELRDTTRWSQGFLDHRGVAGDEPRGPEPSR